MREEKEWTSLVGCVKAEKLSNEQKFVLITMDRDKKVMTKGLLVTEVAVALVLATMNIAKETAYPELFIDTLCELLQSEKSSL